MASLADAFAQSITASLDPMNGVMLHMAQAHVATQSKQLVKIDQEIESTNLDIMDRLRNTIAKLHEDKADQNLIDAYQRKLDKYAAL